MCDAKQEKVFFVCLCGMQNEVFWPSYSSFVSWRQTSDFVPQPTLTRGAAKPHCNQKVRISVQKEHKVLHPHKSPVWSLTTFLFIHSCAWFSCHVVHKPKHLFLSWEARMLINKFLDNKAFAWSLFLIRPACCVLVFAAALVFAQAPFRRGQKGITLTNFHQVLCLVTFPSKTYFQNLSSAFGRPRFSGIRLVQSFGVQDCAAVTEQIFIREKTDWTEVGSRWITEEKLLLFCAKLVQMHGEYTQWNTNRQEQSSLLKIFNRHAEQTPSINEDTTETRAQIAAEAVGLNPNSWEKNLPWQCFFAVTGISGGGPFVWVCSATSRFWCQFSVPRVSKPKSKISANSRGRIEHNEDPLMTLPVSKELE